MSDAGHPSMRRALRDVPYSARHVLVTGANGFLGALVVASLLRDSAATITCLTRGACSSAELMAPIVAEWEFQSQSCCSGAVAARVRHLQLPDDAADVTGLAPMLDGVDAIVHCAGCLDDYDVGRLQAANIVYTAHLLVLARRLRVRRFVYLSTAHSCGFVPHVAREALHAAEPGRDPSPYTRTKRDAERLVAASGVPFVVLRPSVVIGTSDTGRYGGNRYGLYEQWMSLERLLGDRHHAEFHAVAPAVPVNLLHQDMFCAAFKAAWRWVPDGAFVHLVSDRGSAPTMRDLWSLWFEVSRPSTVYLHASLDDVPLARLDRRQRAYLIRQHIQLEIAAHDWQFETGWLDRLRERGLVFVDATRESVQRCQRRFVESSDTLARHTRRCAARQPAPPRIVDAGACRQPAAAEAA